MQDEHPNETPGASGPGKITLTFVGGPRDGDHRTFDDHQLPEQDAFEGYWIENAIVNDQMAAVPLWRASANAGPGFEIPGDARGDA